MADNTPDAYQAANNTLPETDTELRERLEKQLALLKEQIAQRKEAEEALRRESAMVKLLQEITAAANLSETIDNAFQFALDRICDFMGWPVGHVYRMSSDLGEEVVSGRIWHCDDDRFLAFREKTESTRFSSGVGWLGKIFSSGQATWIVDVHEEPDFVRSRSMERLPVHSGFAFPVLVGSEIAAVLEFFTPDIVEQDDNILSASVYIGTQLGRVIERVRAKETLEHSRALLADAERLASLGSWEWDTVNNKITWSDELLRIYGLHPQEFGGSLEAYLTLVHPDDRNHVATIIQDIYQKKTPFRYYHRIVRPDGQVRILMVYGKPSLDKAGGLEGMVGTSQDVTEQKEAENTLTHQAKLLTALGEMGQTVTSTLELETVFEKVLDKFLPLLGAEDVFILLLEGDELVFVASSEIEGRDLKGSRVLANAGVAGEVLQTGQAKGFYGREAGTRVFRQIADSAGYQPGALLVAPLKFRGELIGIIEALHPEPDGFNDEDLQLLEAAASWTAIAISNARLFERHQEARRAAELLRETNLKLTESLELPIVLETLLDHLTQLLHCDVSSVKLRVSNQLVLKAVRGRQHHTLQYNLATLAVDHPLKVIAEGNRSLLITDTATYSGWDERLGSPGQVQSWLGVPLLASGSLIGVYTAGSAQANFFRPRHLLMAEALAGQAAIAVQNARLFSQVSTSRERLRYLTRQVVTAQEAERRRVSRELHDEAGQALTSLKISLDLIRTSLPTEQVSTRIQLAEVIALVDETMEQIRLLAQDLRPPVLDTFGLNPSLQGFCDEFARRTGLTIHYEGLDLPALSDTAKISFYRFLQEALNNAAKYAEPTEIWVSLQQKMDSVNLSVKDNGRGFVMPEEPAAEPQSGVGLVGMQERFELLGGVVDIRSVPGEGTEVTASVPLEADRKEEVQ